MRKLPFHLWILSLAGPKLLSWASSHLLIFVLLLVCMLWVRAQRTSQSHNSKACSSALLSGPLPANTAGSCNHVCLLPSRALGANLDAGGFLLTVWLPPLPAIPTLVTIKCFHFQASPFHLWGMRPAGSFWDPLPGICPPPSEMPVFLLPSFSSPPLSVFSESVLYTYLLVFLNMGFKRTLLVALTCYPGR